jgi:putative transposase
MGQSLVKNHVHLVWSTKHRQPFIVPPYEEQLHRYMAGICTNLGCTPIIIGGWVDHVHILCKLSQKIPLMKLMEDVKSNSSKWMKTLEPSLEDFYWQDGYGAFSVNPTGVDKVVAYIANQHKHHAGEDFQSEYRGILNTNGVEYDERYVWD